MSNPVNQKKKKPLSPYAHLFIPIAFFLGLGSGYLLWGKVTPSTAQANGEVQRVEVSTDDDPSLGPEDAPITIIEFSDFQCPYCATWYQQTFARLIAEYPDQIRFVYRDLPLPMHSEAIPAAEAANCANEQGAFWQYHNALFSGQYVLGRESYEKYAQSLGLDMTSFTACLDDQRYQDEILADAEDASQVGINGTPSFVINGRILVGALPYSDFKAIIDEELGVTN